MKYVAKASVGADRVLAAIREYEHYPAFVEGVKAIRVERVGEREAVVHYDLELGKRIQYSCRHQESERSNSWVLLDGGGFLKKNLGSWTVQPVSESECEVVYEVDIEFSGFVPSLMINPLIQRSLPRLVQGMIERASHRFDPHK